MTSSPVHAAVTGGHGHLDALRPWGATRTLILTLLTFGLFPLLTWRRQWARQLEAEQQFLKDAVEITAGQAATLRQSAEDATTHWLASTVIGLCALCITWFVLLWQRHEGWNADALLKSTYLFTWSSSTPFFWQKNLFLAWTLGLSLAYAAHWAAIQWHVTRLQKLTLAVNRASRLPVVVPQMGVGLGPRWIIAAAIMVLLGAYWGILVMMAAGAQRQYVRLVAPHWWAALRAGCSPGLPRRCTNPSCQKALTADAVYCPRCGAKV